MNKAFLLPRRRTRIRPYLDFTAMIDTVFNLLIFFAVISTFAGSGQHGIAMDLPKARIAQPVVDRVVLALQPGQQPQINGRLVPMQEIGKVLDEVRETGREAKAFDAGMRRRDGSLLLVAVSVSPVRDEKKSLDFFRAGVFSE